MTIGNQLKKARQKKQLTIEDVHKNTRIHPNVLEALEEDRFNVLSPAYVRSFLKEYAVYLELDVSNILDEYNKLCPKEKTQAQSGLSSIKKGLFIPAVDIAWFLKAGRNIVLSVLTVIICIYLIRVAGFLVSKASKQIIVRQKQVEAQRAATAKKIPPAKAKAQPKSKAAQTTKQKAKTENQKDKPPIQQQKGIVAVGEKLKLTITVMEENVFLQVKSDGKIMHKGILKKRSPESWTATDNFTLLASKAEAVQLNLNGTDLGILGQGVKEATVTREGIRK